VCQAVFESKPKIEENNMKLLLVVTAMIASMLFAADAAYALGGGGHRGDGRRDASQPAAAVPQDVSHVVRQDAHDQEENPGNSNNPSVLTASVPEPITALLVGIGICLTTGLIVTRRKQKS
jgi:hypothetical protein